MATTSRSTRARTSRTSARTRPPAKAGLEVGDVVVKVDDKSVTSAASLGGVIRQYLPGETVQITVDRGGSTETLTATLGESPTS